MLRSEQNPEERLGLYDGPTNHKTAFNKFEARCRSCGELYFVDGATFESISDAVESGYENPFACADCEEAEADESARGG